jgi:hypothetical protein
LSGLTYEQAILNFTDGALIGISKEGSEQDTNPDSSVTVKPHDKLIVITRRGKGVRKGVPAVDKSAFAPMHETTKKPQRTLLLGWNDKAPEIIRTLDQHFTMGSTVKILAELDGLEEKIEKVKAGLSNQALTLERGNIRNKTQLSRLIRMDDYNHVILLCYSDVLDVQSADALTLITLLQLRQISQESNSHFTIVSEILDIRNRALAEVTHADDFIVSDNLISMVMAQLACNINLKKLFDELLTPGGSDIYLRPVTDYVTIAQPVNFYTIASSASRYNQTVMGYRITALANSPEKRYGVMLAPCKEEFVQFTSDDKVIVIANY